MRRLPHQAETKNVNHLWTPLEFLGVLSQDVASGTIKPMRMVVVILTEDGAIESHFCNISMDQAIALLQRTVVDYCQDFAPDSVTIDSEPPPVADLPDEVS